MSIFQQIKFFALKGLLPSYYWRHFILIAWIPALIYYLLIAANKDVSIPDVLPNIIIYAISWILYPFARFAYEAVVEFIMGHSVILFQNVIGMLICKMFMSLIIYCFAILIAPKGFIILFFMNKKAYNNALAEQAQQQNNQEQQQ